MKKKKIVRYNKGISWQNILILVEITFHFQNNDNMNLEWEKRKKEAIIKWRHMEMVGNLLYDNTRYVYTAINTFRNFIVSKRKNVVHLCMVGKKSWSCL